MYRWIFLCTLFCVSFSYGQNDSLVFKNGIAKPNSVSAHHFGMFHLRINQNFQEKPVQRPSLQLIYESANSFQPFLEAYLPEDPTIREAFGKIPWYNRSFEFIDQQSTPAEYMNIIVDAVFKVFRIDFKTPLTTKSEFGITLRTFMPNEGHYPFSIFTSDESIEWFHSNIAGGEDAFGRRFFGLNKVNVSYQDRNGRSMNLKKNQIVFAGIELNHFYYPQWFKTEKNLYTNIGSHIGINTSSYNPTIDLGISANMVKKWLLKNKNELRYGIGLAGIRKSIIEFETPVDFGNNLWMGSAELNWEFTKYTRKGNTHSFSLNYQIQTSYNKREEADYYFLDGGSTWQDIHSYWQSGFSTLYEYLSVYTFFYNYQRPNFSLSLYLKEDLRVNNAPDLQTCIAITIPLVGNSK